MKASPGFQRLIDVGTSRGWSHPERQLARRFLAAEGSPDVASWFHEQTCFIPSEELVSSANVLGLVTALDADPGSVKPGTSTAIERAAAGLTPAQRAIAGRVAAELAAAEDPAQREIEENIRLGEKFIREGRAAIVGRNLN